MQVEERSILLEVEGRELPVKEECLLAHSRYTSRYLHHSIFYFS